MCAAEPGDRASLFAVVVDGETEWCHGPELLGTERGVGVGVSRLYRLDAHTECFNKKTPTFIFFDIFS